MPSPTLPGTRSVHHPHTRRSFRARGDTETDAADLRIQGRLPADPHGVPSRNGPNPEFFDPFGITPSRWKATACSTPCGLKAPRYRNRWVRTQGLAAEEKAGRALFGGTTTPAFVDQALLGSDPDPGWPGKLDAFINIVGHAGRYLALGEGLPAYEESPKLATLGRFDSGGGLPLGACSDRRLSTTSGEMVVFRYDMQPPYLHLGGRRRRGTVARPGDAHRRGGPGLQAPRLRHHRTPRGGCPRPGRLGPRGRHERRSSISTAPRAGNACCCRSSLRLRSEHDLRTRAVLGLAPGERL